MQMLTNKLLVSKKLFLLVASTLIIFLTVISLKESDGFLLDLIPFTDKILHLSAYIVLTFLWSKYLVLAFSKVTENKILITVAILLLIYGIIIEVLQSKLTTTRMLEFTDVVANFIGIVFGVIIFKYISKLKLKSNKGLFF